MESKVSIIIPLYNTEKYIEDALVSCACQSYKNIEVIVINDGSTDSSPEIVNEFVRNRDNFRMITTDNRGLSEARNLGLEYAEGEYIVFLDADDWIEAGLVEESLKKVLEKNLEILFFGARIVGKDKDNTSQTLIGYYADESLIYTGEEVLEASLIHHFGHSAWQGFYKKKFLDDNGIRFIPGIIYEDVPFWFSLMNRAESIMYTNTICYNYRLSENSIMRSEITKEKMKSVFAIIRDILNKENISEAYKSVAAGKIVNMLVYSVESGVKTSLRDDLLELYSGLITDKREVLRLIDELYYEDGDDLLKSKYYLVSNISFAFGAYDEDMKANVLTLRKRLITMLSKKMCSLPFHTTKMIGVYGSGANSDAIINTYRRIFGDLKCDYLYIDSAGASYTRKHQNRDIINVDDLDKYGIQEVVICSNIYEDEMYRIMKDKWREIPVYRIYGDSKVTIAGLINHNYVETFLMISEKKEKRIILVGTPEYRNTGDHIIAQAELDFFQTYFPEYYVIEITSEEYTLYKSRLKTMINKDDIIVVTGGGFFGSLWAKPLYDDVLDLIEGYTENRIIIMPQSIFFEDTYEGNEYAELTRRILASPNVRVCLRERYSYECLKNILGETAHIQLFPDIALYYRNIPEDKKRQGIGLFIRRDKEAVLSEEDKQVILDSVLTLGEPICESSMQYPSSIFKEERQAVIDEKISEIQGYRLVITDMLHCMIVCALTGTPCIAFNNISRKVEGVYEWIKDNDYIKVVGSAQDLIEIDLESLPKKKQNVMNPVKPVYWENLYEFIRQHLL